MLSKKYLTKRKFICILSHYVLVIHITVYCTEVFKDSDKIFLNLDRRIESCFYVYGGHNMLCKFILTAPPPPGKSEGSKSEKIAIHSPGIRGRNLHKLRQSNPPVTNTDKKKKFLNCDVSVLEHVALKWIYVRKLTYIRETCKVKDDFFVFEL